MIARAKRPRVLALLIFLGLVLTGISAWNLFGLSLPLPPPTSTLTAVADPVTPDPALLSLAESASPPNVRPAWTFDAQELIPASPVVVGDRVYVVAGQRSATGRVIALDRRSGEPVWTVQLGTIADHAPVVAGDLLYLGARDGTLRALDRHTGAPRWSFQGRYGIAGRPVVVDGVLYVGSEAVFALDAATGQPRWRRELNGRIVQPLAYADGVLAVIAADHHLYLLDAENGRRRLTFPLWFNPLGGPTMAGQTVAVSGDRAYVQALQLHGRDVPLEKTFRFFWTRLWLYGGAPPPPVPRGYAWQVRDSDGVAGHLIAADSARFYLSVEDAAQTGRILALDSATGTRLWDISFPSPVIPSATLLDDLLVAGTADGHYMGMDVESGRMLWAVEMPGPVIAAPAFARDLLLAPLADGTVRALAITAR